MSEYNGIMDNDKFRAGVPGYGGSEMSTPVSFAPSESVPVDDEPLDYMEESDLGPNDDSSILKDYLLSNLTPLFLEKARGKPHLMVWAKQRRLEISLPIGSTTAARAAIETCISLSGHKNKVLEAVISELARDAPYEEQLQPIGQGLQLVGDSLVAVTGGRILIFDSTQNRWTERPEPVLAGHRPYLQAEDWLSWTIDELNSPPIYGAERVLHALVEAVDAGWGFSGGRTDAIQFVLSVGAQVLGCLLRQQVIVHINASSSSGKSRLLGLCTGRAPALGGKALIPNHVFVTDATAPGIVGLFRDARMTLLLDEAEVSGSRNVEDLLALIRSASGTGSTVLRGKREGGHRGAKLSFGAILASIEPILSLERDRNRSLVTELTRDRNREDPWLDFDKCLREAGMVGSELSRSWFLHLTSNFRSMQSYYRRLLKERPAELDGLPQRRTEVLAPLLAVAMLAPGALGQNYVADLGNLMVERDDTGWASGEVADLHDTLFNGPFSIVVGHDNQGRPIRRDMTILKLVEETQVWTGYPEVGVYLSPQEDGVTYVLVNWGGARNGPLKSHPILARSSGRKLMPLARELPEYHQNARVRIGGQLIRLAVFKFRRWESEDET